MRLVIPQIRILKLTIGFNLVYKDVQLFYSVSLGKLLVTAFGTFKALVERKILFLHIERVIQLALGLKCGVAKLFYAVVTG